MALTQYAYAALWGAKAAICIPSYVFVASACVYRDGIALFQIQDGGRFSLFQTTAQKIVIPEDS